jgi:hypothetical protein
VRYVLIICALVCNVPQIEAQTRFTESKGVLQGDLWLKMSSEIKEATLRGYLGGYVDGQRKSCSSSGLLQMSKTKENHQEDISGECSKQIQRFHQDVKHYILVIDEFYEKYPKDRDVPFNLILLGTDKYPKLDDLQKHILTPIQ